MERKSQTSRRHRDVRQICTDFSDVVYGRGTEEIHAAPLQQRLLTDCNFDSGECEWVQEKDDDLDWAVHYHRNGLQYYMVLRGIVGNWREQARLKLLLHDGVGRGAFCLRFSYRIAGLQAAALRVMMEAGNTRYVLWEQRHGQGDAWHTNSTDVAWSDRAPEAIVFEGTRGRLMRGEIALDNVLLISGSCRDAELY